MDSLFPDPDRCAPHNRLHPCQECARIHGEANKLEGMDVVAGSPDPAADEAKREWSERAHVAIRRLCVELSDFTGDELLTRGFIEAPPGDGRLVGPAMRRAALAGWVWNTHTTRKSTNPAHNAQPREVWISLLFGGPRVVERCTHCAGLGHTVRPAEVEPASSG